MTADPENGVPFFFYGTLMSPIVLSQVISGKDELSTELVIHKAEVQGYSRHAVKDVKYPAVRPSSENSKILGTIVYGLSGTAAAKLDIFEGDEYSRENVPVADLETNQTIDNVNIYVIKEELYGLLEDRDWDFGTFTK
jgi:gamma-glutamylcyclotransferase (GGCT)/AIG2-like uncharacterized protein YtfP